MTNTPQLSSYAPRKRLNIFKFANIMQLRVLVCSHMSIKSKWCLDMMWGDLNTIFAWKVTKAKLLITAIYTFLTHHSYCIRFQDTTFSQDCDICHIHHQVTHSCQRDANTYSSGHVPRNNGGIDMSLLISFSVLCKFHKIQSQWLSDGGFRVKITWKNPWTHLSTVRPQDKAMTCHFWYLDFIWETFLVTFFWLFLFVILPSS